MPPIDHECAMTAFARELLLVTQKQQAEIAQLKKALLGPKSERSKAMASIARSLGPTPKTPAEKLARRRERAEARAELATETTEHKVADDARTCPKCSTGTLSALGEGRVTHVIDYVPGRFVRRRHVQEVLRCSCNGHIVTAVGAPKVVEGGHYGASVIAQLVIAKCIDSFPIYRLEKKFEREGLHLKRSTMNELFHKGAVMLAPLSTRLLAIVAAREIVQADETRLRMLDDGKGAPKNGFIWTFVAADVHGGVDVAYRFAADRSADTANAVLGGTTGFLVVDGYAGYNRVVDDDDGRVRVGCHAHVRRYFHDALPTSPVAQEPIDLILELYRVEDDAKARDIVGTAAHLALRKERSTPVRERLKKWLDDNLDRHPPKSPIGVAIRYAQKMWKELGRFLEDARLPLDNNASERALRRVALGRKNFLFVGDATSGEHIAGLYSLAATCEARNINPLDYFTDVISRVGDHPMSELDALLPANWAAS
jgi:transposase